MTVATKPSIVIFLRDEQATDDGHRYGCKVVYSGTEPIGRSMAEWEYFFLTENDELAPRIREGLAAFKKLDPKKQKLMSQIVEDTSKMEEDPDKKKKGPSPAARLLKLAEDVGQVYAFRDERNDPYVCVILDGAPFIMRLNKKDLGEFGDWLTKISWDNFDVIPKENAIKDVTRLLRAKAIHGENVHPLWNRVAEYDDSFMYYLGDQKRRVVEINPKYQNGWIIFDNPPILFRHYSHMLPQDEPKVSDGGYLDRFINGLNLSKDGKLAYKINLAADLVAGIAHAGTSFDGPSGSTKSTMLWAEKTLIDPSSIELMPPFKDMKELRRAMDRHYIVPLDNISHITREMSDELARGITGIAMSDRGLYTDDDDFIRKYKRIIRLNGISQEVKESDLISRLLLESVPELDKTMMREEKEVRTEILAWRPYILGELFTIVSKAMTIKPTLKVNEKPRMSDWYTWAMCIAMAIGVQQQDFVELYQRYEEKQHGEAVNQSIIAPLIKEAARETLLMDYCHGFYGTAEELLHWLVRKAKEQDLNTRTEGWPKDGANLGKLLRRIVKDLRSQGVEVVTDFRHEALVKAYYCFAGDARITQRKYGKKERIILVLNEENYREIFSGNRSGNGNREQTTLFHSESQQEAGTAEQQNGNIP